MKVAVVSLMLLASVSCINAAKVTPIEKVVQMLADLEVKIIKEGTDGQKIYDEFSEFCEDRSRELGFEIKDGKGEVKALEAEITHQAAAIESLTAKIEELAGDIATDEADLKAATEIRVKEKADFEVKQAELKEIISTLERAIAIIEKEVSGGASMMQIQKAGSVVQALAIMVQATSLSTADAQKLTSLLQQTQEADEDAPGAPAATVYKSHSAGIVETMEDLLDKAEAELDDARKAETKSIQAYEMLAQSLKDEIKYATKDMDKAKKAIAKAEETKATAEGDLAVTSKDLKEDIEALATLHADCMKGAEDFESETKSRGEELKALATAKKIITETTAGAAEQSYGLNQLAFVQVTSRTDLANFEAVRFVRDLAQKQKSPALAQLAIKMTQAMHSGAHGKNPFAKVEGLIKDMIAKLEKEAEADATEKAFCDKAMAETEEKKQDKEEAIAKLTTSIDSMSAKSAKLKEEVATLQKELAELARSQAEMDKVRAEEKAAFETNSAEMKQGLDGVKLALKVLREYYSNEEKKDTDYKDAEGAGAGIIGLLEVCESDFSKGLAEMIADEESAAAEYVQMTKENEITKATKEQDVKYKTQEYKALDKSTAEATSDRETVQEELDAVMEYYEGLKERCIAKPEPYEERVKRRNAEIAGLKEALEILNGEAVLLQSSTRKHTLRGKA